MSTITLTGLKNHFETIAATVEGLHYAYFDDVSYATKTGNNYPLLVYTNNDSTLSADEIQKGFANETHKVILNCFLLYPQTEREETSETYISITEKYDAAQALLMEFIYKAFSREYIFNYTPVNGINNISVKRRDFNGQDQVIGVTIELSVKVFTGCSEYTNFTTCAPVTIYNHLGAVLATVNSGGVYSVAAPSECNPVIITKPDESILTTIASGGAITTTAIITLMSALELYSDLTTAEKINAVIALLSESNLQQLTPTQLDYIATILTNSNLDHLTTAQKNYVVTILQAAQIQLLSNSQLQLLSAAQVAYVISITAPTTYNYPVRTGETISYALYDDLWTQANIFNNIPIGITPRLADWHNLRTYNNIYGNVKRFTGITGGYQKDDGTAVYYNAVGGITTEALAFPDNYVIDHFTGLGWRRDSFNTGVNWSDALSRYNSYSMTVNGIVYNDLFLPSVNHYNSIRQYLSGVGILSPFAASPTNNLWTSTSSASTQAIAIATAREMLSITKSTPVRYMLCRKHF